MATTIKPRRTTTASKVPTALDLQDGELGVNVTDGKTYVRSGLSVYLVGERAVNLLTTTITDGDTTHAPDGNAVYDALALKANLSGANFTGMVSTTSQLESRSMFPLVGFNPSNAGLQGYVGAWSGRTYMVVYDTAGGSNSKAFDIHYTTGPRWDGQNLAIDSNVVHKTGDESIAGTKTFTGNGPIFAGAATNILGDLPALQFRAPSANRRFRLRGLITDASDGNFVIDKWTGSSWAQIWEVPTDSGWTSLTPATGWANYGNGFANIAYRKIGNVVRLRGVLSGASVIDNALFTLPAAARPSTKNMYRLAGNSGQDFYIDTAGKCAPYSGTATGQVSLDGVQFLVD